MINGGTSTSRDRTQPNKRPAPITFEENRGIAGPRVLFFSRGKDYSLALTRAGAALSRRSGLSFGIHVERANARTSVIGLDPQPGTIYYARGNQLIGSATYHRVKYAGIYKGIDLEYYGRDRNLEFDFVVQPHANPRLIRLSFTGAQQIILGEDGDLRLRLANDQVILQRPIIYQIRNGMRQAVSGGYVISRRGRPQVRFAIGPYDQDLPLVIDPTISYATYLGSPDDDRLVSIDTNAVGELYVFGATTNRFEFPAPLSGVTNVGRLSSSNSEYCFLSKFDTTGSNLLYSVIYLDTAEILGPAHCDAMTVSPAGTPYTVYQSIDASFTKTLRTVFDSGGTIASPTKLLASLEGFLPAPAIKVDADGYVYAIGGCFNRRTQSPNPYPLPNGFRPNPNAGKCTSPDNFFSIGPSESIIAKYDVDGNLVYGSFLAGPVDDASAARALEINPFGVAYIGGHTASSDTPHTGEAFQPACADNPCDDGFVEEIDTTMSGGSSLRSATFLGGIGADAVSSIALGSDGSVTIAGETASFAFPTENGPADASRGAVFAARFAPGPAGQLLFTRFITTDSAFSGTPPELKLLGDGAIAIAGITQDSGFPLVQPLTDLSPLPGFPLPFLTVFSPNANTLRVSTTFAGPSSDPHLTTRGYDDVYVGMRTAVGGQSKPGAFQSWIAGGADLLLIKISGVAPPNTIPIVTSPIRVSGYQANIVNATSIAGASVPLTALVKDSDGDPLTVTFAGPLHDDTVATLTPFVSGQFQADAMLAFPLGTSVVTMTVSDGRGGVVTTSAQVTVLGAATTASSGTITVSPVPMLDRTFAFLDPKYQPLVKITLGNITGAGVTTVNVRTDGIPPLPDGYQLGSPPYYYDVTSTVPAAGPFTFCVDIEGMSFADPNLRMFVRDGISWSDITNAAGAHEVCGQSAVLGTYVILHTATAANTATTLAGSGYYPGALDGPGGDPRDDFINDGQLPTSNALSLGRGGVAIDRARKRLYTTTLTQIRRVDLNPGGTLDTIAGDGFVGDYSIDPDDGSYGIVPATNVDAHFTHITNPNQLALDREGNLYIAEFCQIRRIDTQNVITTVAGDGYCRDRGDGGPATVASIDVSPGVAIDPDGQIIILEQSGRIRRVRSDGAIETVAFVPQDWIDGGFSPVRIAIATNGDFYIVGGMAFIVRRAAAEGQFSVINRCALTGCTASRFGGDGRRVSEAQFQRLLSIAVDRNGDLLVGDSVDHRIRRIAAGNDGIVTGDGADEIVSTVSGYNHAGTPGSFHAYFAQEKYGLSSAVSTPWDIVIDPNGGFLFANGFVDQVRRIGAPADGEQVDITPPSVSCTPPLPVVGWVSTNVVVACTASDSGSGLTNPSNASFSLSTSVFPGTETTLAETETRLICDLAGNCAPAGPYGPFMIDRRQPAIVIDDPDDGAVFILGAVIPASYTCDDGEGSGVASCTGSVPSGSAIDTTTAGAKTFTINASDRVGNPSSLTVTYSVVAPLTPSAITVVAQPNPSIIGQSVTVTATVTGSTPTGTVNFYVDGFQEPGSFSLQTTSPTTATASTSVVLSTIGSHDLSARYFGDALNAPSVSAPLPHQVVIDDSSGTATKALATNLPDDLRGGFSQDSEAAVVTAGPFADVRAHLLTDFGPNTTLLGGQVGLGNITVPGDAAAARAVTYRTYTNTTNEPLLQARADVSGMFIGSAGRVIATVYVFDASAFLSTVRNSGKPLPEFLLGTPVDTLTSYASAGQSALSLANLFPTSALLGSASRILLPANYIESSKARVETTFPVAPGQAIIYVSDFVAYDATPSTLLSFGQLLDIGRPDIAYSVSASPASLALLRSSAKSSTITLRSTNGVSESVQVAGAWNGPAPAGVTFTVSPGSVTVPASPTGGASAMLNIAASASAETGLFTLRLTATSASGVTTTIDMRVLVSEAFAAPTCGCTKTGAFENPRVAGLVRQSALATVTVSADRLTLTRDSDNLTIVNDVDGVSEFGFSPNGKYFVLLASQSTLTGPVFSLTLYSVPAGRAVGAATTLNPLSWGFSPDADNRFFVVTSSESLPSYVDVQIFNTQTETRVMQTALSNYSSTGQPPKWTDQNDVKANDRAANDNDKVGGWGFSPDGNTFVLSYKISPNFYEFSLSNLTRGPVTGETRSDVASFWQFSPCGDLLMLVSQKGPNPTTSDTVDFIYTSNGIVYEEVNLDPATGGPSATSVVTANSTFEIQLSGMSEASIKSPQCATSVSIHSPANIVLVDETGRRMGFDPVTGGVLNEIPGGTYTGVGSEPQTVTVPYAREAYLLTAYGLNSLTSPAPYTLRFATIDAAGDAFEQTDLSAMAFRGSVDQYVFSIGDGPITPIRSEPADAVPPEIHCAEADGQWHGSDIVLVCGASDSQSGLVNPADASFSLSTHVATGTETANASTDSRQVCDNAGNCATAGPISGNKIDKKGPSIVITSPTGTYALDQTVPATYSCADVGSGIATCAGTVPNGANINTASEGTMTFGVTATDVVGNKTAATVTYAVVAKGAADQIRDLIALVKSYGLSSGLTNNLVSKLQSALDLVNSGKSGACGKLKDFIDTVNAQAGKGITQTQAAALIAGATRIRAVLGCP
jgi:Big-like domain-containing protein